MAKCDEGYLCEVCGEEVDGIAHSDLYLRFVIGEMDPERLHTSPERHIVCNPVLAQFINDDEIAGAFRVHEIPDGFRVEQLDSGYVQKRRQLVTRGYRRLLQLATTCEPPAIHEYPLAEVRAKWQS